MPFVHLHTHSEYSLLDGANRIPDLLDRIRTLGMDSLAITDHGNLHGAWQFYSEAKSRGVRPILGFEAYVAFGSRHKRERPVDAPAAYSHLVLLAKNRTGYRNLIKLSSIGFLEGYYRRPRIDREALEQHKEGLIGLAACLSGEIALYLRQGNEEAAKASARYFAQLFGKDGFWLEVQDHGLAEEKVVSAGMFRLGQELGLPVLATNDAHYLKKDDAEAHDVLLAAVEQRLAYELDVIQRTGYAGYFLIVYDLIKAARDRGIPTGPGRGSSAGSLVAYALGITAVDPLKFDLLFERFLNPERVSMPDIDLDFCFERRSEGIEYVHAAGLVIAPGPLADYVPVCIAPQDTDAIITQYDMVSLEQAGMLKIDLLGLKTLTVIHDAVQMIQERHGVAVDPATLDLEDAAVYELLRSGRTAGVFQFESPLATDCLRNMKCDRFDDLAATNALMRPGPLDSGMHLVVIRRKRGDEPVRYPHAALRDVLEPTYGLIVYQEQVMRIANVLAGYTLAEADVLRKAVGKKDKEMLQRELGPFVERAVARGFERRVIEDIAAQIETFGRYGFPKAHSVAYSILSFQTAWFKAHYPGEFMSALLSSEIGNTDKVVQYINEARELGLEVLAPDVNESGFKFTVVGDRRVRFGLGAIKNVGGGAIESIIAGRQAGGPYRSLVDLCDRIDLRLCNKRVLEALIDSGACASAKAWSNAATSCARWPPRE